MANKSKVLTNLNKRVQIPVKEDEELRNYTTWRVGGPAQYLALAKTNDELESLYKEAQQLGINTLVLGGGSNVLISDDGVSGLVIINESQSIRIIEEINTKKTVGSKLAYAQQNHWKEGFLKWDNLEFSGVSDTVVRLEVSSGTPLGFLINTSLKEGITGLEFFSRIPGTIGGAIWNNIHGWHFLIEDFIESVTFVDENGTEQTLTREELGFSYNGSIFQHNDKLIVSAVFNLFRGDADKARKTAIEWTQRKSIQPFNSAGSVFCNLAPDYAKEIGLESLAAGFVIDSVLNLKGYKIGDAWVSNNHANFIETGPNAKAHHILELIDHIKSKAKEKGIILKEEINKIGF